MREELTDRQVELVQCMADDMNSKQIARKLGITFKTVDSHRTRAHNIAETHTAAGLVAYGFRHGLIK